MRAAVARTAAAIERVVGMPPAGCPWRAYHDPIVRAVVADQWAIDVGAAHAVIHDDAPAVIVDAHAVWRRALECTWADERAKARERDAAERELRRRR